MSGFFEDDIDEYSPSDVEIERRNRIRLSIAAYSYEYENDSIISDGEYDQLSRKIKVDVLTDNLVMDEFFKTKFSPDTGMWIRDHPNLAGIKNIYFKIFHKRKKSGRNKQ